MKRVLLFTALIVWSAVASAIVYKWVDADGKVHYGDRPPDGVHAEVVELIGTHVPRAAAPAASQAPRPAQSFANNGANQSTLEKERKSVDADVAATHEQQCTDAQARYKQMIEGRRLYKLGASGEREYLSSEEIDSERMNAKREVDAVCGGAT